MAIIGGIPHFQTYSDLFCQPRCWGVGFHVRLRWAQHAFSGSLGVLWTHETGAWLAQRWTVRFTKKKLWRLHQNPVNFWANIHIMIILCVTLMQSILWRFKFRQLFNQQPGPLGWSARPTQLASVLRSKPHCDGSSYHHWIGFVGKICYKRWILPSNMVKHGFCNQIWGFPACFSLKP